MRTYDSDLDVPSAARSMSTLSGVAVGRVGRGRDGVRRDTVRAAWLCAALGAVLYLNTLNCGFAFDDKAVIVDNEDVRPNVSWMNLLRNDFWGAPISSADSHKSYRPLTMATFRLNYMLHELQPLGYHLVNVLLHSAVCYLYVLLCGVVFSEVWPALIAGLLFAVHPIHTEAVAGLVGRAELLSCLFFILSIYHYILSTRSPYGWRRLLLSLVCVVCSLVSKEQGITVVAVCVTYDLFIANQMTFSTLVAMMNAKSNQWLPRWSAMLKRTVVMAMFTGVVMGIRLTMMGNRPSFNPLDNEGLYLEPPYRGFYWAYLVVINTWLLLNPSHLLHDYRMGAIPLTKTLTDPRNMLTILTFSAYLFVGLFSLGAFGNSQQQVSEQVSEWKGRRTRERGRELNYFKRSSSQKAVLFGLAMLVFPFVPASNLFMTVGFVVAERVLYLPSLGACFIAGYGAWVLISSAKKSVRSLAISGVFLLIFTQSVKVVMRNPVWESKLTLYEAGVKLYPENGNLLGNIGLNYRRRGDSELAEKVYRYSMEVAPNASLSFMNFGVMLKEDGRLREAEEVLKLAAEKILYDPTTEGKDERKAKVHITVGNLIQSADHNRLEEALQFIIKGVSLYPTLPNAHNSKGSILHKMGRILEAKVAFEEAIRCNPNYANAHFNLGLVLYQTGNLTGAVFEFKTALRVDPNHKMARLQLESMKEAGEL